MPQGALSYLGYVTEGADAVIAIVATHDCDCVAVTEREPYLELVLGKFVDKLDGTLTGARSTRLLHLHLIDRASGSPKAVQLTAAPKVTVEKSKLESFEPDQSCELAKDDLRSFVRWLRARYDRASFPDDLIVKLRPIVKGLESQSKQHNQGVHGIYMAHDPEGDLGSTDELYELSIAIPFDSDLPEAKSSAEEFAETLRTLFERAYLTREGVLGLEWKDIYLTSCLAISDLDMSFRDLIEFKLYRLDYVSLRARLPVPTVEAA